MCVVRGGGGSLRYLEHGSEHESHAKCTKHACAKKKEEGGKFHRFARAHHQGSRGKRKAGNERSLSRQAASINREKEDGLRRQQGGRSGTTQRQGSSAWSRMLRQDDIYQAGMRIMMMMMLCCVHTIPTLLIHSVRCSYCGAMHTPREEAQR